MLADTPWTGMIPRKRSADPVFEYAWPRGELRHGGDSRGSSRTGAETLIRPGLRSDLERHAIGVLLLRVVDLLEPIDLEGHAYPITGEVFQD